MRKPKTITAAIGMLLTLPLFICMWFVAQCIRVLKQGVEHWFDD